MENRSSIIIMVSLCIFLVSGSVCASSKGVTQEAKLQEAAACQNRMRDFITPNVHHELLRSLEGDWNAVISFRSTPENPISVSQASVKAHMVMGGRYLERNLKGKTDNFEARIINGFDNFRREFTSVWYDNMCTGMITGSGQYDPNTKTIVEEGSMSCPITGQAHRWYRSTTKMIDENNYTFEMFKRDDEGEEFKTMTIAFDRVK